MGIFIATDYDISFNNGRYYIENAMSSILCRYYERFGKIIYCSRIDNIENTEKLIDITEYIDSVVIIDNLFEAFSCRCFSKMEDAIKDCNLVVGRVPSIIAYRAFDCAKKLGVPFFTEAMGCAWDAYWNHGLTGKIIAPYMFFKMKSVVKNSDYALYVTNQFLQNRYPCKKKTVSASNVKIEDVNIDILEKRISRIDHFNERKMILMTCAAVDVRYKGQEYVIKAIPILNKMGIKVRYILAGGGNQEYLRCIAKKNNVSDQVEFLGRVSLKTIFEYLDNSDIYIQPSLQEGLPRSVIEAMSRACPSVGARTAGIPELLDKDCVFKRKSEKSIAKTLKHIYNKDRLKQLAQGNFNNSRQYHEDVLSKKRNMYYNTIIDKIKYNELDINS